MRLNSPLPLLLAASLALSPCQGGAQSYEEDLAKNLSRRLNQDEVVWLTASGRLFLALYKPDFSGPGAVILVHGMGGHPDWPEVVGPLRDALPGTGWSTLSIQMPVLAPDRQPAEYGRTVSSGRARLRSAVQFLDRKQYREIIIIGYGFGAGIAADYLANNKSELVKGFVGISMQTQQFLNPRLSLLPRLEKIGIPVLDIYGSRDFLEVIKQADDRRLAGRKGDRRNYQQVVIEGADHYFTGQEETMIKKISSWLNQGRAGTGYEPGT